MTKPSVKICCISSKAEALTAIKYGASAIGLVGEMPSGPGVIDDKLIYEIARIVPPSVATFLLTSETRADDIIAHHRRVQTTTIQIVDKIQLDQYQRLRDELPGVKLVQVIHVIDHNSVKEAIEVAAFVDAILLDSGNPNLKVKELGGTGRTHNWDLSREIREKIDIPLFLAGGINKENVKQVIAYVKPFGIDLCSSVRTNGHLDETKLAAFFSEID
ncbi:MAG: phosphoribosylanthranilate isomerase [Bacteroidetes bacterium]|nr:phosphoribosylanthranilate isomerase [Bacteroidota bacterium]MBU1581058.1 phosphoribosylanthranilate isomerase [Bacteroidota bacterium]MBU2556926.1 phosphoribosylanthranilate isomerase [Bacteroidota bacterium]